MNAKAQKLAEKLGDAQLAAALVAAGLDNPAKIRKASDAELERVKGVGKGGREKLRGKFKERRGHAL